MLVSVMLVELFLHLRVVLVVAHLYRHRFVMAHLEP
jgi:hypothetical protein